MTHPNLPDLTPQQELEARNTRDARLLWWAFILIGMIGGLAFYSALFNLIF